jgi:biotin-dependent carboxylase-like uncharacterized protein
MKVFEVVNPGMLTTVQDLGRNGYQKYGLAVSGSVDHYAHRVANILVSNPQNAAVLEITLFGLKLVALESTVIAITGGDLYPTVNNQPVATWSSIKINKGDEIQFKGCKSGCRAYLAVAGGIDVPLFFGSRSTDVVGKFGGVEGRGLEKGDLLHAREAKVPIAKIKRRTLPPSLIPDYSTHVDARVILGPQDDAFESDAIDTFLSSTYTVTKEMDRMACRLDGPKLEHQTSADIDSEGLFLGSIQVPKNGLPIVFLTGRQSVGGYTKIGGVISVDLSRLAQVKQGNTISFHQVTMDEAHDSFKHQEKIFKILSANMM